MEAKADILAITRLQPCPCRLHIPHRAHLWQYFLASGKENVSIQSNSIPSNPLGHTCGGGLSFVANINWLRFNIDTETTRHFPSVTIFTLIANWQSWTTIDLCWATELARGNIVFYWSFILEFSRELGLITLFIINRYLYSSGMRLYDHLMRKRNSTLINEWTDSFELRK